MSVVRAIVGYDDISKDVELQRRSSCVSGYQPWGGEYVSKIWWQMTERGRGGVGFDNRLSVVVSSSKATAPTDTDIPSRNQQSKNECTPSQSRTRR